MQKRVIYFFLFISYLFFTNSQDIRGQFQPTKVEKSTQKVLLQGNVYYIHTILQGQTLYSICKTYGVTTQDISNANPGENIDVLKPGQTLKIPDSSNQSTDKKESVVSEENSFIYHTVQPKENVYFISRKYNLQVEDIYKYNPGTENGLKIGQVLKVPKTSSYISVSETGDSVIQKYIVKEGDTLYCIAQQFDVSVSDFINTNPELRWGLKPGMALLIPGKSDITANTSDIFDTQKGLVQLTSIQCDSVDRITEIQSLKVALIMPFFAKEMIESDSLFSDTAHYTKDQNKIRLLSSGSFEFYDGIMLAINELKKENKNITLFTFDTRSDTNLMNSIIRELEIIKPNLIIGPLKNLNVSITSKFSSYNKIPLILPLSKAENGITENNPFAVFISPNAKTEIETFAEYVSKFNNSNIIIIHQPDTSKASKYNIFKSGYLANINNSGNNLFNDILINDTLRKNLNRLLRKDIENIVVLLSDNEASVINIVSLLSIQPDQIKIKLFGLPSWQHMNNLRTEQLHKLNCILYSPFFVDYQKPETIKFIEESRKILKSEPYKTTYNNSNLNFTYLGYETLLLFGKSYFKYGDNMLSCICNLNERLPQSNYSFTSLPSGGFINNSINLIEFNPDYTVNSFPYVSSKINYETIAPLNSINPDGETVLPIDE